MIVAEQNITPVERVDFVLTAANPVFRQAVTAEFIYCFSAAEDFDVLINKGVSAFPMGQSGRFSMPRVSDGARTRFAHVEIRRKAGAAVASNPVTLLIGSGDYESGAINRVDILSSPGLAVPLDYALDAITPVQVQAADDTIREVFINNNSGSIAVRLNSTALTTTTTRGLRIPPNGSATLTYSGDLFAIGESGAPSITVATVSRA